MNASPNNDCSATIHLILPIPIPKLEGFRKSIEKIVGKKNLENAYFCACGPVLVVPGITPKQADEILYIKGWDEIIEMIEIRDGVVE